MNFINCIENLEIKTLNVITDGYDNFWEDVFSDFILFFANKIEWSLNNFDSLGEEKKHYYNEYFKQYSKSELSNFNYVIEQVYDYSYSVFNKVERNEQGHRFVQKENLTKNWTNEIAKENLKEFSYNVLDFVIGYYDKYSHYHKKGKKFKEEIKANDELIFKIKSKFKIDESLIKPYNNLKVKAEPIKKDTNQTAVNKTLFTVNDIYAKLNHAKILQVFNNLIEAREDLIDEKLEVELQPKANEVDNQKQIDTYEHQLYYLNKNIEVFKQVLSLYETKLVKTFKVKDDESSFGIN